ncbi:MAG: translation initiation factor IF-2, partial [Candidatus Yanofskybacteria bacterium]|nr:translation initiation factor IF-2 [Candidatus Yanofskybacteria bacterium]
TSSSEVTYRVLDYSIGNITEADVQTAAGTHALILGFRVGTEESARRSAEKQGITIATYDIIYELIERVRAEMGALLSPEVKREALGKLRILAIFKKSERSCVVGGKVSSGIMKRGAFVDLIRGSTITKLGKLGQLQHNKEDVTEVKEGLEAGLRIDFSGPSQELAEGDILEAYEEEHVQRSL